MRKGAILSPDRKYRYVLWREWDEGDGTCLFVMLNPSTANANKDDQTIRKCIGFAERWGCNRLEVVNLYAYRATDPKKLLRVQDPVGPDADFWIRMASGGADRVVAAWGASKMPDDGRIERVMEELQERGPVYCLGKTKGGDPCHPRQLAYKTKIESFG